MSVNWIIAWMLIPEGLVSGFKTRKHKSKQKHTVQDATARMFPAELP